MIRRERRRKRKKRKEKEREAIVVGRALKAFQTPRRNQMKKFRTHSRKRIQEVYQKRNPPRRKRRKTKMKMTLTLTWANICFERDINLIDNINIHQMGFFNDFLSGNTQARYVSNNSYADGVWLLRI